MCEDSHLDFCEVLFKARETTPFTISAHHQLIADAVDRVVWGEITRLIINVPPGYTKTEMAVVALVARGFAINPRSRFMHVSFSDPLVRQNSRLIMDTMNTPEYRDMWGIDFRTDSSAKDRWNTRQGGGLVATTGRGTVTGFRAGTLEEGFTGALIIDDPLKPADARYPVKREFVNDLYHDTLKSRPLTPEIPVIVIMQRLHKDDLCGHLLTGGTGEMWHHLMLPVEIKHPTHDAETGAVIGGYPSAYTHGIPIEYDLPEGPLWPQVHDQKAIEHLKLKSYVYQGQYAQRPTAAGGVIFNEDHLKYRFKLDDAPYCQYRAIYVDTAQKTKEENDFTVLECWGYTRQGKAILIDLVRGKFQAPELKQAAREFWKRHSDTKTYPHNVWGALRAMRVEDKVSGTGLIQELQREVPPIPVTGIQRITDKFTRAQDVLTHFALGNVMFPVDVPWWADYEDEMLSFTGLGDSHDDQVDPTLDAVNEMLVRGPRMTDVVA